MIRKNIQTASGHFSIGPDAVCVADTLHATFIINKNNARNCFLSGAKGVLGYLRAPFGRDVLDGSWEMHVATGDG